MGNLRRVSFASAALFMLGACGCSTNMYVSYPLNEEVLANSDRSTSALVYFLPRRLIRVQVVEGGDGSCRPKLTLLEEAQPDPRAGYLVEFNHSYLRTDDFDLNTTNTILSASNVTTKDETLTVVQNLVDIVSAAKGADEDKRTQDGAPCRAVNFVFDPADPADLVQAQRNLGRLDYALEYAPPPTPHTTALQQRAVKGLVYRPSLPHQLRVSGDDISVDDIYTFVIPNGSPRVALPVKAGRFVQSTNNVLFKDGEPTKIDVDQPSEAAAISAFPYTVLKRTIEVPAQIFKLRIDQETLIHESQAERRKSISKEIEAVKSQRELLEEIERLEQAKKKVEGEVGQPDSQP